MHSRSLRVATLLCAAVSSQSLDSVLGDHDDLSAFRDLLSEYSDFLSDLDPDGDVTILAPSNSALEDHSDTVDTLRESDESDAVRQLLNYHVLNGRFHTEDIPEEGVFIPTFLRDEPFSAVRHGQVVYAVPAHDGDETESGDFKFYSGYNNRSNTAKEESDLNIEFDGGLIHVISAPLTIPPSVQALTWQHSDLVAFNLLFSSIGFDLDDPDASDMTWFVPTNQAFENMWSDAEWLRNASLSDDGDEGQRIQDQSWGFAAYATDLWLYHFINDTTPVYTSRIDHADWITALRRNVTFAVRDDNNDNNGTNTTWWVNNARIVEANWLVRDGVVHVVDQLLNPNNTAAPAPTGQQPAGTGTVAWDVDRPVDTLAWTDVPRRAPPSASADPPSVTPTWTPDRPLGLALGSDDEDGGGGGGGADNGDRGEDGPSEGGPEDAASAVGVVKLPVFLAGLGLWAFMFML